MSLAIYAIDYISVVCVPNPQHHYILFVPSQWRWRGVCAARDVFGAAVAVVVVFLAIALLTTKMVIERMETEETDLKGEQAREVRVGAKSTMMLMET